MAKIISAVIAVVVFVAFLPVFGQESVPSATVPAPTSSTPIVEGDKKGERQEMENEREGKGKGRKGKGRGRGQDKKRGLDRAEEVAGEHGKHGRDRARGNGKHRDREKQHDKDKHQEGEQQERD